MLLTSSFETKIRESFFAKDNTTSLSICSSITFTSGSVGSWVTFYRELDEEQFYIDINENYKDEKLKICLHSISNDGKKDKEQQDKHFILQSKISNNKFTLGTYRNYKINYTKIFYSHHDYIQYINSYYWKKQYPNEKQPSRIAWSEDEITE